MSPPSSSPPLQQTLLALMQTLQFSWFAGHVVLLLCFTRYFFSWLRFNYYATTAMLCYRVAFIAAAATYGIVVFKTLRSRAKAGNMLPTGPLGLLADENVHYLVLALVWLIAPQYPIALIPYTDYSLFHVATYTRSVLLPVLQQQPASTADSASADKQARPAPSALGTHIGNFIKSYYEPSMAVVANLELALWFRLVLAAALFQRRSWLLLAVYTVFMRLRYAQNPHLQSSFGRLEAKINTLVGSQGTPTVALQTWNTVKTVVRQFHAATDINRYVRDASVPKKTT